jgi:toluene monooxygenase system protein A
VPLARQEWLDLARDVDWDFTYVREEEVFPEDVSGRPWLRGAEWRDWSEPFQTTYSEYVRGQAAKEQALAGVRDALGGAVERRKLPRAWTNGVKLHAATFALAEFAAVVGNLRAARFGRSPAWRTTATLGALDEIRHTQIPLLLLHDLVRWDRQFDWTHKFFHSNVWVAIAARHMVDELLVASDPVEFAIGTNFVFETGFTNLQFLGLAALGGQAGDRLFERMATSIQTDEARHAQIGLPVLEKLVAIDRGRAQYLVDKWFWRSWLFFAVVTGVAMDYLTPLERRTGSFKEFVEEWILDQFERTLASVGLERPWYWHRFVESIDWFHHMIYASAYSYRATVWFDMVLPGPDERAWLRRKYPSSWDALDPIWRRVAERWSAADPGVDFEVHGSAIVGFCSLCQLVLCQGTPEHNRAVTHEHGGRRYVFCSEPCRWIFQQEPQRYEKHLDLVQRVLAGQAPGNVVALLTRYCGLDEQTWGKDAFGGVYPWLERRTTNGAATPPADAPRGGMEARP